MFRIKDLAGDPVDHPNDFIWLNADAVDCIDSDHRGYTLTLRSGREVSVSSSDADRVVRQLGGDQQ